jgi:predicted transcriptional regulator
MDHECAMMIDFRNGAGLSLEKAAEATHYERRTVSRYEKYPEKANPQAILALSRVYQSN